MRTCATCDGPFSPIRKGDTLCQRCVAPPLNHSAGRLIVVHSEFPRIYDDCLRALSREGFSILRPHESAVQTDALATLFMLANDAEAGVDTPTTAALIAAINRLRIT